MKKSMEQKLNALYQFLKEYQKQNGFCPSVREMCDELKVNSTSTITYYLNHLEKEGKIRRGAFKNRAIEIINQDLDSNVKMMEIIQSYQPIPILGQINAGEPILAVENFEEVFYMPSGLFRGDDLFMLTVSGESMIEAGIQDGDKVVIRKQDTANNGDIVAALIDDSATIKRFYKEDGHFRLQPENPTMEPMFFDEVTIIGKVVGLIRNMLW